MTNRPTALSVNTLSIPDDLKAMSRWVLWRNVKKRKHNGWTKMPFAAKGGAGSSTDETTWCSFDEAADAMLMGDYDGLGIVLGGDLHGIDLDDCRDPKTGVLNDFAKEVVERVHGYAEISPSGTGLKIFCNTNLDGSRTKKEVGVELYRDGRFFTVTGHVLPGRAGYSHGVQDLSWLVEKVWHEELGAAPDGDDDGRALELYKPTLDDWDLDRVVDEVLVHLDPDGGYEEWLEIGMALHHQGEAGPEWLDAWDNWSAQSGKWVEGYCGEKWSSFSEQRAVGRGAVTLASLLHKTNEKRRCISKNRGLVLHTVQELMAMPPLTWLVKGVIPDAGMGLFYGDSGAGKTFISIDLALAINRGVAWQGCKVKKPTEVLYISAEGGGGISKRLMAYSLHHGVDLNEISMRVITVGINLRSKDADRVIDCCTEMSERGNPFGFIVIDTLNRTMGGADENGSKDMGEYLDSINRISRAIGAFILMVHHSGKDFSRGARGHSSLRAAVDTEMSVKDDGQIQVLTITKSRDGKTGKPYAFKREEIKLGIDDDLDLITSCVALPADIKEAMSLKPKPSGKWQVLVFEELKNNGSKWSTTELLASIKKSNASNRARDSANKAIRDLLQKGVLIKEGEMLSIA